MQHVDEANEFIKSARAENVPGEPPKNKVLIHCFAGKSRATTFTICYMMKELKINLKDSLDMIWKVRPVAAPNPGFMVQLKALERLVFGDNSDCELMLGVWKEKLQ